jgi:hypothetical protein
MNAHPDPRVRELRDSVAWSAGVSYERRRIGELIRQRAIALRQLPGPTSRTVQAELNRLATLIEDLDE